MKRYALVTGGAVRVGKLLTEHLLNRYDGIIIIFRSSETNANKLQDQYGNEKIILFQCDLSEYSQLISVADQIFDNYNVQLLVNNASTMINETLLQTTQSSLLSNFSIHLFAPIFLSQYLVKHHKQNAQIINILDIKIYTNQSKRSAYLLSKKSLEDFTQMAALEFAPTVRVNGIAIGWIYDPNGKERSQIEQEKYLSKIPLKQKVSENQLLTTFDYILDNEQLTGQILNLAGGSDLK